MKIRVNGLVVSSITMVIAVAANEYYAISDRYPLHFAFGSVGAALACGAAPVVIEFIKESKSSKNKQKTIKM